MTRALRIVTIVLTLSFAGIGVAAWTQPDRPEVLKLTAAASTPDSQPQTAARALLSVPNSGELITWDGGQVANVDPTDVSRRNTRPMELVVANSSNAVAHSRRGRIFAATRNQGRLFGSDGRIVRSFPIPLSESVAALPTGDLAVASATVRGLIHVYSVFGAQRGHFGVLKNLDADAQENRFLNQGIILAGPASTLIYIFANSPSPVVQLYDREGKLNLEFSIGGASLDAHLDDARTFLVRRQAGTVGGFKSITTADFDEQRGSLFIATTARHPGWESIYEYSLEGDKLAEYSLHLGDGTQIERTRDLAVQGRELTVIDHVGRLHTFELPARTPFRAQLRQAIAALGWLQRGISGLFTVVSATQTCAQYVTVDQCQTGSCSAGGGNRDCRSNMCNQTNCQIVTSQTCTSSFNSCSLSLTTCANGISSNHGPLTMNCPTDADGDGYTPDDGSDCNDGDPSYNPGVSIGACGPYGMEDTNCNGIGDSEECLTPIVIDVLGDGFHFTSKTEGVKFDLFGDGDLKALPWTAPRGDDAWLAMDRNGNGRIDSGKELWGAPTDQPPSHSRNGYIALAEFDLPANGGNDDEIIDRHDAVFARLLLWRDTNHDGVSQPHELMPVSGSSITSIDLNYREFQDKDQHGNWFRYKAPANVRGPKSMVRVTCDVYLWAK